jgi:hypothetical protein
MYALKNGIPVHANAVLHLCTFTRLCSSLMSKAVRLHSTTAVVLLAQPHCTKTCFFPLFPFLLDGSPSEVAPPLPSPPPFRFPLPPAPH